MRVIYCTVIFALAGCGPTFELQKAEWRCSADHVELIPITQQIGNTPITTLHPLIVCDQWTRK